MQKGFKTSLTREGKHVSGCIDYLQDRLGQSSPSLLSWTQECFNFSLDNNGGVF